MHGYGWAIWLIALVVFGIAEAATVSMVSLWFMGGALAAMIAQFLGAGPWVQIAVFLVVSAVLLACLRPFVRKFVSPKRTATNIDALIGREAIITEVVDDLRATGALKLDGREWTARSAAGETLPVGTVVKIVKIEGVKLYVEPVCAAVT
ncbi:MAG: NfeD family protein [Oscillospiraceae bacterium]|nr:NfeD family protein [Oscillospiraceae bacterium]